MIEFKVSDFVSPGKLLYWRCKLWRSQYYDEGQLKAMQWRLLSSMLNHCFEKVPFYRKLFNQLGLKRSHFNSLEDLSKIPVLDKFVLQDRSDEFRALDFQKYKPRAIDTSGTTGTPLRVYWDLDSNILELTCQWRHFSWAGYKLGDSFLDFRSRIWEKPSLFFWNRQCRGLEICSDLVDESNIHTVAGLLRKYRVKLWRGHPSAIHDLCRLLDDADIQDVKPRYISTAAEAVLNHHREFIETWSRVPVCDSYGLREHNALICQCPEGGYHIASEYGIIEILREDGTPAQPGEEGRIVATGLHNRAFPLLRYDTRDYGVVSDKQCSCSIKLPLVEKITGRIDDRIKDASGKWVSGLSFAFFSVQGVRMAQLIQEKKGALDVYLVPGSTFNQETGKGVLRELRRKVGREMDLRLHVVREVPHRKGGKFKFVIRKSGV